MRVCQHRPAVEDTLGKDVEPSPQRHLLAAPLQPPGLQLDQAARTIHVACMQRVLDRLGRVAAGSRQALARRCRSGTSLGVLVEEPGAEQVGEQVVVAVPARRSSSGTRNRLARSSGSSIAGPPVAPVTASHSGPVSRSRIGGLRSRKLPDGVGLALEHLVAR